MMKKFYFFVFACFIVSTVNAWNPGPSSMETGTDTIHKIITDIQADSLIKANDTNPGLYILDVRTSTEFLGGHLKNAHNIDYYALDFAAQVGKLDRSKIYLVYCAGGSRSLPAYNLMVSLHFRTVFNMVGGISKWRSDGFPVVTTTDIAVSLKVFLEGPFNGSMMNTTLNTSGLIPKNQPFNVTPWNYAGGESVNSLPNTDIIDWILVELRQADVPANATTTTTFARRAAFLKKDGSITDLDGISPLKFNSFDLPGSNKLYVVIRHNNHLAVMSSAGATYFGGDYSYDFITGLSQAYEGSNGYKQIGPAVMMVAGDIDQDGSVFVSDYNPWAVAFGLTNGYDKSDIDMDGKVFVSDYNKWATNFGTANAFNLKSSKVKSKYFSCVPE